MEREQILQEVARTIRRYLPDSYRVLIFGSWARGDAVETSDLDIGIIAERGAPVPSDTLAQIRAAVAAIPTLRKIEVVDLNAVREEFRTEVLSYAKTLTP